MKKGKLIIVCGPSGSGKGTVIKGLIKSKNVDIQLIKTCTTREPKKRDKKTNNHIYISKKDFLKQLKTGEFAESNFYNGNYYGTLKKNLDNIINSKKIGLLEQNLSKALSTKSQYKEVIVVFIYSPLETIRQRLIKRGENSPKEIKQRLKIAQEELTDRNKADYIVENTQNFPEKAIEEVINIVKNNQ